MYPHLKPILSKPCRYAGILSAVGTHLADLVQEAQEPAAAELGSESEQQQLAARLDTLEAAAVGKLVEQGFSREQIRVERFLNLR